MRIISPFKDYYDNQKCFSYCSDDFMYVRKMSDSIPIDISTTYQWELSIPDRLYRRYSLALIGFCGKYYPVVEQTSPESIYTLEAPTRYIYKNFFQSLLDKKDIKCQMQHYSCKTKEALYKELNKRLNTLFDNNIKTVEKLDLFVTYKTPILYMSIELKENELTLNPNLEAIGFAAIIEGHQAYQQIEQFLGSELLEFDNPNQITDDLVLAGNHGFNKNSFRGKLHIPKRKRKNKK